MPMRTNASGMPTTPVPAQADTTRAPTTSRGVAAVMANMITAMTPRRSFASDADTALGELTEGDIRDSIGGMRDGHVR